LPIQSITDLNKYKEENAAQAPQKQYTVLVGLATCGIASGAKDTFAAFDESIKQLKLQKKVDLKRTGCIGLCYSEPTVEIIDQEGNRTIYQEVTASRAKEIAEKHLKSGHVIDDFIVAPDMQRISLCKDEPLTAKQVRIALRNCGLIDPENINDYIARDGYAALAKCLFEMQPADVIQSVKASGLRGRGGGGFPTGVKWEFVAKEKGPVKHIICNADEGDPGAFMDRSILEGDPHSVLEAMAIAGYATGASHGYIYIRAEYPLAVTRLNIAIAQATEMSLLGQNIMGTDFTFTITIKLGAGAFVCGEEMALIHSIEGNRGEPTIKPPFPAQKGLFSQPTCVNNVETFANICAVIMKGPDWFAQIGTAKSKGTKVFALAGKINKVGLIEVPMGITLKDIIYEIGGGIKGGKRFKAIQTGGPSGGVVPYTMMDIEIDYDNLIAVGSMMGSGGMIVMDEDNCMVDIAKFYLEFTVDESCGRCTPCRVGNKRLYEILEKITSGEGTEEDLYRMRTLGQIIKDTALCGLGQTSPNPVLSTMHFFEDEYMAHVKDKTCPAMVCRNLIRYYIMPDKCTGCTLCAHICPTGCIKGNRKEPHTIHQTDCIKCGSCFDRCRFGAIIKK